MPSSVGVRKIWVRYRTGELFEKLDGRPSVQSDSFSTDEDGFVTFDWEMWATRSGSRTEVARLSTAICGNVAEYKWTACALRARPTVLQGVWKDTQSFWRGKTHFIDIFEAHSSLLRSLERSICLFVSSSSLCYSTSKHVPSLSLPPCLLRLCLSPILFILYRDNCLISPIISNYLTLRVNQ